MFKRYHLSIKPISQIYDVNGVDEKYLKPNGLWYSINGEWEILCSEWGSEWGTYQYKYELTIDTEKLLILKDIEDIKKFENTYLYRTEYISYVNWNEIKQKYDGIEIQNYRKYFYISNSLWLRSWDCSSGCIWRKEAVKNVSLVEEKI